MILISTDSLENLLMLFHVGLVTVLFSSAADYPVNRDTAPGLEFGEISSP